jgi:hypothetical protein
LVIQNIAGCFRIDISSTDHERQGLKDGARTNRSFGKLTPCKFKLENVGGSSTVLDKQEFGVE